jgi:hypothetical protein
MDDKLSNEEWIVKHKEMQKLLKKKKQILKDHVKFMEKDIEELEFVIKCYKQKIESFK